MRLIDADSAKLAVSDYKIFRCQLGGLMDVAEFIDDQPTIDAVPVVRCRECKHLGFCGDATNLEVMGFYGYCSRGERKEGTNNGIYK